jgi:hypothetical protein
MEWENGARWKWYVLDCAFDNGIASVQVNASAGRERFRNWISAVAEGTTDEATIKVNMLWVNHDWKMRFAKFEGWWVVIITGEWVVKNDRVGFVITANSNVIKCLSNRC